MVMKNRDNREKANHRPGNPGKINILRLDQAENHNPGNAINNNRVPVSNLLIFSYILFFLALGLKTEAQMIVAHRGASKFAPENTISSFKLAWKKGADAIEGDYYLTKDGHIVCIHDSTTKRTTGVNLRVSDCTLAQLKALDAGAWKGAKWAGLKIPTIEEVLGTVPKGKTILIEIKCGPEIVPPLKKILAKSKLKPQQVVVIAFSEKVIAETKKQMPAIKAYWLTSYKQNKKTGRWSPAIGDVLKILKRCNADGLDTNCNFKVIDSAFVKALRKNGFEFHAWTVDDAATANRLQALGVDSITTNRPVFIRKSLNVRAKKSVGKSRATLKTSEKKRPNILFAIADDWGWPHAGAYGDKVVKTPAFDRLAREGVLFKHAYISSPSCTPSRGAILTGRWHWQLEGAANLWSVFPDKFTTYPELLGKTGYATGYTGKGWAPGRTKTRGRELAGKRYKNFKQFLDKKDRDKPFCFWLGSYDPHRPYKKGSGAASGMKLEDVHLFDCFPDQLEVRSDVADYYFEVQRFDRLVGDALAELERRGELDNTIVVMTGDHGMPFPRCKSNLYDSGTRVPLAIRWPGRIMKGRTVTDFVSLTDLAPTFMEVAGLKPTGVMTGQSLMKILTSKKSGRIELQRDFVLTGKERHVPGQEGTNMGGYPCRSIRTYDFLYIRNFCPDRWPAGTPDYKKAAIKGGWLADCDNGPTKSYMVKNRNKDALHRKLYDLAFGKRPAEELYDLKKDPGQLNNVAGVPGYKTTREKLSKKLLKLLLLTRDPRVTGEGEDFDNYPYLGGAPKYQR